MDNPFGPPSKRKGQSPPPKNNFQQELQAKMYQRKKAGLTADVTPSESGQESEDELGSDNELMSGFNISSKSKSPGRKSPYNNMNGYGHKPSKSDIIFGKKTGSHYEYDEDDDDLADAPNDLLMTMKKPMVMSGKGGKKQPQQRHKSPLREEDEVDANMSSMARYMKQDQKKTWQPPSFQKPSSLEKDYDHEQLQLDLQKTKHRPKSPKPGRKTPSDLDSITEERGLDVDLDDHYSPKSGRQYGGTGKNQKPTPKPRESKSGKVGSRASPTAELKSNGRAPSPTTDIFGSSSKNRSKLDPFAKEPLEKEDFKSFMKNKDKKEKEKKEKEKKEKSSKSPSVLDMLSGGSLKDTKSDKKDFKGKKQDKAKHLTHDDDSDDSIGGEFKRKDGVQRKTSYGKEEPLGRFSRDTQQGSAYDRERGERLSPFDPRNKKSPFDQSGRKSPLDGFSGKSPYDKKDRETNSFDKRGSPYDRKSPYYDGRGDERRSPLSIKDDRKTHDLHSPKDRRSQGAGIYEKDYHKKNDRDKSPNQKKENPFARTGSRDREEEARGRSNERDEERGHYGEKDPRYSDKDHRYGDKDHRYGDKDQRYGDKDHRYGDKDQNDFRNKYGDSDRDRYGYDDRDARKEQYRDSRDDKLGKKSPFGKEYGDDKRGRKSPFDRDYEDSRKSQFDKRDDRRGYDDLDRGFGRDRHVGFEQDMNKAPTLKGKYDTDRRSSPFERGRDGYADRKPSLRKDDREEYDKYSRQKFEESKAQDRGRSRSRGKKDEDRESSLCRDVDEDPSKMKKAPTEEEEKIKKHKVKSHTKQNTLLDQVIESVKEEQTKFKPVDPDKNKGQDKQRSQSARHRPKPRYAKPVVESFPSRPSTANVDFNNTTSIRDAVFLDWYKDRNDKARKEKEEKLKKEKEEAAKKKKEEEDKKLEAMASYNCWAEKKKEDLYNQEKKKRKEERKKVKSEDEKQGRKEEAAKMFQMWKEDKDAEILDKEREKKREEQKKIYEEEEKKKQKKKDAKTAYKSWNEKKEVVIQEKGYDKRQEAAKKQREERRQKELREKEALKSYDKWMQKKEKDQNNGTMHERQNRKSMKTRRLEEMNETRPAWSPASRTVPFGR